MDQTGLEESGARMEADAERPKSIVFERPDRREEVPLGRERSERV